MKILFTFECSALSIRAIDYINLLLYFGHEVSLYNIGTDSDVWSTYMSNTIANSNFKILKESPNFNEFNIWNYDLTSFERSSQKSLFINELENFRKDGILICVNYEDGYVFFINRINDLVINKKSMAIPEYRSMASAINVAGGGVAFPNTQTQPFIDYEKLAEASTRYLQVYVTENDITRTQRKVAVTQNRAKF